MRWKLFTLLAVLALMVSTASPVNVKAQDGPDVVGLVEIEYLIVGIGPNQGVEISGFWYLDTNANTRNPSGLGGVWVWDVTNPEDATCTETVQVPVELTAGLNTHTVSRNGVLLLINGEEVTLEDDCFNNAIRVAIGVGVLAPSAIAQQLASNPNTVPVGFSRPVGLGYSVVDLTSHKTVTSGFGLRSGTYVIREVVP
jgi:hypothetical protein